MKFCTNCNNMYYYATLHESKRNEFIYHCRYCKNTERIENNGSYVVIDSKMKKQENKFNHIVNQYTKYDPTLPRIHNIQCISTECPSREKEDGNTEVIYMLYDENQLKYLYICVHCNTTWKTNDEK